MKKLMVPLLVFMFSLQAFAVCEGEKHEWDRAKKLADTWGDVSACSAAAGVFVGILSLGPLGGLCGGVGLAPGLVAKKMSDAMDEKERAFKKCNEDHIRAEAAQAEKAEQERINQKAETAGKAIGSLFRKTIYNFREAEIDALIEKYLSEGRVVVDPESDAEVLAATQQILARYQ